MRKPHYLLIVQVLVIPLVILIFKMPAEKKILSLIANGVFWLTGLITVFYRGPYSGWAKLGGLQFLLLAVIPISILRFLSWNTDFNKESLLGVTGSEWHAFSNTVFLLMIGVSVGIVIKNHFDNKKKS